MTDVQSTEQKKTKKKFKMPSAIVILIGALFILIVISWIVAWTGGTYTTDHISGYDPITGDPLYDGTTDSNDVMAMGIFGIGLAIGEGFVAGSDLIFYLLVLGAIIELMLVSGAMESGINSLVKGLGGKELFLIPILFTLFSAGGTIYGMSEETIALFVIIVPALCLAGFDTITGLMVVLGGTATGCAVSTVNPFAMGAADSALESVLSDAGVETTLMSSLLVFNLIWWIIMTAITCSMITCYAWYTRKNPKKSFAKNDTEVARKWLLEVAGEGEKPKSTKRQNAAMIVFMISFLLMILMFIPWPDIFTSAYDSGNYWTDTPTGTKDPIFGLITPVGWWYFGELSMMFIFVGVIIALILGMSMEKTTEAAWAGAKGMLSVGIIIAIARGIPFILETTGLQPWLIQTLIGEGSMSSAGFIYLSFAILFILSIIITSTSGLAGAALPLIGSAGLAATGATGADAKFLLGGITIAYMMAIGFWNFFVPTNPIVMASMQYSRVAYIDGLKLALPMALTVLVVTLGVMIPSYILIMG